MKKYTFEIYRDKKKEYRWRLLARNGRVVGDSAEGYKRKGHILRFIGTIQTHNVLFFFSDKS